MVYASWKLVLLDRVTASEIQHTRAYTRPHARADAHMQPRTYTDTIASKNTPRLPNHRDPSHGTARLRALSPEIWTRQRTECNPFVFNL